MKQNTTLSNNKKRPPFQPKKAFQTLQAHLPELLERYLSELLKIKVDLVMKSALKPAIGRHILEETQPV